MSSRWSSFRRLNCWRRTCSRPNNCTRCTCRKWKWILTPRPKSSMILRTSPLPSTWTPCRIIGLRASWNLKNSSTPSWSMKGKWTSSSMNWQSVENQLEAIQTEKLGNSENWIILNQIMELWIQKYFVHILICKNSLRFAHKNPYYNKVSIISF